MEQTIKDSEGVAEILTRDLLNEKNRNEKERQEFENVRAENRVLKSKASEMEAFVRRYDKLFAERQTMELKIAGLEKELSNKDAEIERIKTAFIDKTSTDEFRAEAYHSPQEVELPPIVLERDTYSSGSISRPSLDWIDTQTSSLRGSVVTVNREHNFVVIDLGRQHGIEAGMRFNVYRGNILIGRLEAIQCRERISACDIEEVKDGYFVEIEDVVAGR